MTLSEFEVPAADLYRGEYVCPFPPEDGFARRQWFFEKAYAASPFTWDVPFRDRFFRSLIGWDQYQYFRGEDECPPYFARNDGGTWWEMERRHWDVRPDPPYVEPFVLFFRDWCFVKAAGEMGIDPESGRLRWLDRYLEFAPII